MDLVCMATFGNMGDSRLKWIQVSVICQGKKYWVYLDMAFAVAVVLPCTHLHVYCIYY